MKDLQLARLTPRDSKGLSDHFRHLRQLVSRKEDVYPGIDKWFDKQVVQGVASGARVGYVGYVEGIPAAAAIVKLGEETKLCHINVRADLQGSGVGEILLSLITLEAKCTARAIHVTFPESLWEDKSGFFQSFTFTEVQRAKRQYRLFEEELTSRTPFTNIWTSVLAKLPKLARNFSLAGSRMDGGVLFSIRPEFGKSIMDGTKTIEIRRRFSKSWKGERAVFYASAPTGALLGQADIVNVHRGAPERIWKRYASQIRCPRQYFSDYVDGCDEIFAVELANATPLIEPICSSVLERYTSRPLQAPQSYVALTDQQGWSEAVNVGVMLQCLHRRIRVYENAPSREIEHVCKVDSEAKETTPSESWSNFELDLF